MVLLTFMVAILGVFCGYLMYNVWQINSDTITAHKELKSSISAVEARKTKSHFVFNCTVAVGIHVLFRGTTMYACNALSKIVNAVAVPSYDNIILYRLHCTYGTHTVVYVHVHGISMVH